MLSVKNALTAVNPEILSKLGNIFIISKLTNLQSDFNVLLLFKLSIMESISDVSLTLLSIFKTSEYKTDTFSIAVPHPLVIYVCIYIYIYIYIYYILKS